MDDERRELAVRWRDIKVAQQRAAGHELAGPAAAPRSHSTRLWQCPAATGRARQRPQAPLRTAPTPSPPPERRPPAASSDPDPSTARGARLRPTAARSGAPRQAPLAADPPSPP